MRLSATNSLLERYIACSGQSLSGSHLRMDAAFQAAQAITSDWRVGAAALLLPFAASRLPSVLRTLSFFKTALQTETNLASLVGAVSGNAWSLRVGGLLGGAATLVGCGDENSPMSDAGLAAPRSIEAQATEYPVMPRASGGTLQGFQASLSGTGHLAVTWAEVNPSSRVFLRVFPPTGNPSNVVEVAQPENAVAIAPQVSSLEEGASLVSWTESLGIDAETGMKARRFSNTGQALGESFTIVPFALHEPAIVGSTALNADGSFVVVSNENSRSCGVCARNYGSNNVQSSVVTLSNPGDSVLASDISGSSQGEWAWAGMVARADGQREIRYRSYMPGRGFGAPGSFVIPNPGTSTGIQLAVLPNNRSLLVWQTAQGLRGQLFSFNGSTLSEPISLNSVPPGSNISVTSDEVGAFIIAWEAEGQIRASLLASNGRIIADNINVSGESSGNSQVTVTANEHGNVSFAWMHFQASPAGNQIVARNYRIRY